jgi:hypothetical protein
MNKERLTNQIRWVEMNSRSSKFLRGTVAEALKRFEFVIWEPDGKFVVRKTSERLT